MTAEELVRTVPWVSSRVGMRVLNIVIRKTYLEQHGRYPTKLALAHKVYGYDDVCRCRCWPRNPVGIPLTPNLLGCSSYCDYTIDHPLSTAQKLLGKVFSVF